MMDIAVKDAQIPLSGQQRFCDTCGLCVNGGVSLVYVVLNPLDFETLIWPTNDHLNWPT
jgi:hypothetical protein